MGEMTVDKAIELALRANRQAISILDSELGRVSNYSAEVLDVLADVDEDVMPAFFDVVGSDNALGVPVDAALGGPANPNYGLITLAQDAPFVATSLVAILEQTISVEFGAKAEMQENALGVQGGEAGQAFGFRIFDVANNSELVSMNRKNGANAQLAPLAVLASADFSPVCGDWQIPETVFPKASSLRVEIYMRDGSVLEDKAYRVHVILCGYKVFGD